MSDNTNKTKTINSLYMFLIWLMLIILPSLAATFLFNSAAKMESELSDSVIKQKLGLEVQKYNIELQVENYLTSALDLSGVIEIDDRIGMKKDCIELFTRHKILGRIPGSEAGADQQSEAIINIVEKFVGAKPDMLYLLAPDPADCRWHLKNPLKIECNEDNFRKELVRAHDMVSKNYEIIQDHAARGIPKNQIKFLHGKFTDSPSLASTIATFEKISASIAIISQRYSTKLNSSIYTVVLPLKPEKGRMRYAVVGIDNNSLPPLTMLKNTSSRLNNETFSHSIRFIADSSSLPAYVAEGDEIAIISNFPESFNPYEVNLRLAGKPVPVLEVSCRSAFADSRVRLKKLNSLIVGYAVLMSFFMTGLYFNRFKFASRLVHIVTLGFFAGILLPLSGAVWLGICYLNTNKQLKAEAVLDFMQEKISEKEQTINIQKCCNYYYHNYFSNYLAALPDDKLKNINLRVKFFSPDTNVSDKQNHDPFFSRRFHSFTIIKPSLDNIVGVYRPGMRRQDTIQPFFSGKAKETLYELGAYAKQSEKEVKQMLQISQMTMGFLDTAIDKRLFIKSFANEQSHIFNNFTTGLGFFSNTLWRSKENQVEGLSLLQFDRSSWNHDLDGHILAKKIRRIYQYDGFDIYVNFFELDAYVDSRLHKHNLLKEPLGEISLQFFLDQAQILSYFTRQIRLNNLNSATPHLINAAVISDNQYFALAYAMPKGRVGRIHDEHIFAILVFMAVISSLMLSRSVAWVLLRSIPVFQAAVIKIKGQNYDWQIELGSGDEFDRVAAAFNQMNLKLHEKDKLSRLVSRNVLDAISSNDEQLLKPGGSRVKATILCSDIRSFTSITEKYPAEQVVELLNDYFTLMSECIEKNGGIIDKLVGDAIQAVFYDHECKNCSISAVIAAKEMRQSLNAFNKNRIKNNLFAIENGVGVCTGTVVCGRVGSESGKLDATIIGSLVNKAANLESLSKHGRNQKIIIDDATAGQLSSDIRTVKLRINDELEITEIC